MFQVFNLFFYVANVASKYFKRRLGALHGIRVRSWRGHERATFGGMGPRETQARASNVWPAWAHAWTRENGLQPRVSVGVLAVPIIITYATSIELESFF
jgi:hypothetical protein